MEHTISPAALNVIKARLDPEQMQYLETLRINEWAVLNENGLLGTFGSLALAEEWLEERHSGDNIRLVVDKMASCQYMVEVRTVVRGKKGEVLGIYSVIQIRTDTIHDITVMALPLVMPDVFDCRSELYALLANLRNGYITEREAIDSVKHIRLRTEGVHPEIRRRGRKKKALRVVSLSTAKAFLQTIEKPTFVPVDGGLYLLLAPYKSPVLLKRPAADAERVALPFADTSKASVVFQYRRCVNTFIARRERFSND